MTLLRSKQGSALLPLIVVISVLTILATGFQREHNVALRQIDSYESKFDEWELLSLIKARATCLDTLEQMIWEVDGPCVAGSLVTLASPPVLPGGNPWVTSSSGPLLFRSADGKPWMYARALCVTPTRFRVEGQKVGTTDWKELGEFNCD